MVFMTAELVRVLFSTDQFRACRQLVTAGGANYKCPTWVLAVSKRFAAETRDEAGLRCELLFPALTMLGSRPSVAGCP